MGYNALKEVTAVTIYADILLALNWWIDYLLLLGVRRSLGGGARPWRLAIGALVGALSCFVLFLPTFSVWLDLAVKLVAALVMVAVAFRWQGWREFARRVLLLFVLSAGLAGLCGAVYHFVAPSGFYVLNGVVYYSVPPLLLVGFTVLCYGILWLSDYLLRRRAPVGHTFRVRLTVGERRVDFPCLYDSGNHLTEPFSGYPVLVVEREIAEQLLVVPPAEELPVGGGWRLIPYDTVGGGGLLPAFIPTEMAVITPKGVSSLGDGYVAVCQRLGRGEYRGLMGTAMGERLVRSGGK